MSVAISKVAALRMFYDEGFESKSELLEANEILEKLPQPCPGYFYPEDVSLAIFIRIYRDNLFQN